MENRIGFYPRYDRLGASSRLRFFQFYERWLREEPETARRLALHPGLSDDYLRALYAGKCGKMRKLREWLRLWRRAFHPEETLLIEYELLPGVPYAVERLLLGSRRYLLNFDDNVWEKYRNHPLLAGKFDALVRRAAGVIVANRFLYEKVAKLQKNLILIPTVVDEAPYRVPARKFDRFTVVWIGTPVTYRYLELFADALRAMRRAVDFELLVVARKELAARPLPGVRTRFVNWSEAMEAEALKRSHVGIMPLADDSFARGKSAYKLIQYQAAGLPALASPVGENNHLIRPGVNGFLPQTPEEWAAALRKLHDDRECRRRCAEQAQLCGERYTLAHYFPVFRKFVLDTLSGGSSAGEGASLPKA